jgi:hypothetical protein
MMQPFLRDLATFNPQMFQKLGYEETVLACSYNNGHL